MKFNFLKSVSFLVVLYVLVAFAFFSINHNLAQSQTNLSTEIKSLLEQSKYKELLELLNAAPAGISAVDLYFLRIRALSGLQRFEEAIRQAKAGFRLSNNIETFGVTLIDLYVANGQFDEAKKFIDFLRINYAEIINNNTSIQKRIKFLESQIDSYDGYSISFIPTIKPVYNITNEASAEVIKNLSLLGRNVPNNPHIDGWSVGFNFSSTFSYYFSPSRYFLALISASSSFKRGLSFSSLKTSNFDSHTQRMFFLYSHPISSSIHFNPSISIDRAFNPSGGLSATNSITLGFGLISILKSNTRLEITPSIGYSFHDNPRKSKGLFVGLQTRFNWRLGTIAGGNSGIGTSALYRHYSSEPLSSGRSIIDLSIDFSINPKDILNINLLFSPRIAYNQFNGFDSINMIPRTDYIFGFSTLITFSMLPLIGDKFFPTVTVGVTRTNSSIPYVTGNNFAFSLGISIN